METLGHADAEDFISRINDGPLLTERERAAIEDALAPRIVAWVESPEVVRGDEQTPMTVPERHAIVTIAVPTVDGDRAEVATELWCGWLCAIGSTFVLERSPDGIWAVTGEIGGYIS